MKNNGFSLVELLVVIAIMAILAGVGVPAYSHFVDEANKGKDNDYVAEIYRMANLEAASLGLSVEMVVVSLEDENITITENGSEKTADCKGRVVMVRFAGQTMDDEAEYQDAEDYVISQLWAKTEPYVFKYDNYLEDAVDNDSLIQGVYYRRKPDGTLTGDDSEKYAEYGSYTVITENFTIRDDDDANDDGNGIRLPSISI